MKYYEPKENEWVKPIKKHYKMCCCDCGLVHEMDFRVKNGKIQFRARRNSRSTGQIRRKMVKDGKITLKQSDYAEKNLLRRNKWKDISKMK